MNELTDQQILRDYAEHRSETAFTELVRRHVDLVHSAAFRLTGETHSAKDVTQAVFVALAHNATRLTRHPVLSGWLHTTARNLAAKTVRAAVCRQTHEKEAVALNALAADTPGLSWEEIAPQLDAALGELNEADRDAVLLRYFERKSAREMAQILGITDDAAQKRVTRAVERLREFFAKRGVTAGASGLAVVISANAVQAAPAGIAISAAALASGAKAVGLGATLKALVGTKAGIAATATMAATMIVFLAWVLGSNRTATATFQGLGDLPGGDFSSFAEGVSADGTVVVGMSASGNGNEAFRWTAASGMTGLGDLPGGSYSSEASGVSSDGTVIVGTGFSAAGPEAFRWTQTAGMVGLGDLPGGSFRSRAKAVSADGRVVVGESSSALAPDYEEAFRWTREDGMVGLGKLPGGRSSSHAYAVSSDGSVIVGDSGSAAATGGAAEAFRWTQVGGLVAMGDFPGGVFNSIAYGISPDGSVVVGRGYSGAYDDYTHEAFRWTAATGLVRLGFAPGLDYSIALAVSADGNTIVGDNKSGVALLWQAGRGMRRLQDVLARDYHLKLPGWKLTSARAITPDGSTIVGSGINPAGQYEAWIVTLKPRTTKPTP